MRLTTDQLVHEIDQLMALENNLRLRRFAALRQLEELGGHLEDGARTIADWMMRRYGMSAETAREEERIAHALAGLPCIERAAGDGRLCWDKLRVLATAVTPQKDAFWAEEAQKLNYAQVAAWAKVERGIRRDEADAAARARYLKAYWSDTKGALRISGHFPGAEGAALKLAIDRLSQKQGRNAEGGWDALDQRRADALIELSKSKLAEDAASDRALVTITVGAQDLERLDGAAEIQFGPVVPSEVARRLCCDASVEVVTVNGSGEPIGVGRRSRIIPPWLERLVRQRDKGCVCCGNTRATQVHHRKHWAHGGRTDLDNLVVLCWKCHRTVHDLGYGLFKRDGHWTFTRPNGSVVSRWDSLHPKVRERMLGPPAAVGV